VNDDFLGVDDDEVGFCGWYGDLEMKR